MKRFTTLFLCLALLLPLLASCNGGVKGKMTVTLGDKTYNADESCVFDRNYTVDNKASAVYTVQKKSVAVYYYMPTASGTPVAEAVECGGGETLLIPTNGCLIVLEGAVYSETVKVEGFEFGEYIPLDTAASVTDASGRTGFLLDHKDPTSFDGVTNALFSSSPTTIEISNGALAIHASRGVTGSYTTEEYGAGKTSSKFFTFYLTDNYAKACAEAFMKGTEPYSLNNSSNISQYGDKPTAVFGDTAVTVTAINPSEPTDGLNVYDETFGLRLSPERKSDFVDVLVFDGIITKIAEKNTRVVTPYPNGYLLSFNGAEAVAEAEKLSVGDKVDTVLFTPVTTPKDYVLLGGKGIVETVFHNESRTGIALAVIYDNMYIKKSTGTNVWGVELAIDKDGKIVEVSQMNVENSGDTRIPDGGYVLSAIDDTYRILMGRMKVGDTAEHITKNGMYSFRKIKEAVYWATGEGEYLSVYNDNTDTTPVVINAFELILDADGTITEISTGGGKTVPKGGYVVSGIGIKYTELQRFAKVGQKVIFDEKSRVIYLFGDSELMVDEYETLLADTEKTLDTSLEKLIPLEYERAYALLKTAKDGFGDGTPDSLYAAFDALDELKNICVPSLAVQDRAAWVVGNDRDATDVKKTVDYAESLGLNTLILSPYLYSYALFKTENPILYRHPDLDDDFDLLQLYIDECHSRGMKLIFMQCAFSTQKPSEEYPEGHYVNKFADKLLITKKGRDVAYFYSEPSYTLNPYDSEVRGFMLDIIKEVLEKYDVDGIQLDYIRFPLPTYYGLDNYEDHGYNADIIAAFQEKYNTTINPKDINYNHELWDDWCQFRCDIITSFVKEVSALTNSYDVPLTCTCFADATDRAKYVFQDVGAWAEQGLIYAIYPMIYSATLEGQVKYGDELKSIIGDKIRIILGIGTYDGETNEVVRDQVLYSFDRGTEGNSIFALEYIQSFKFDDIYRNSLYRTPAVTTDEYGTTARGYAEMLRFLINETYSYKFSEDYTALLDAIKALETKYGDFTPDGKSKSERQGYLTELATALRALPEKLPSGSEVKTHFESYVETIAMSLERTAAYFGE